MVSSEEDKGKQVPSVGILGLLCDLEMHRLCILGGAEHVRDTWLPQNTSGEVAIGVLRILQRALPRAKVKILTPSNRIRSTCPEIICLTCCIYNSAVMLFCNYSSGIQREESFS